MHSPWGLEYSIIKETGYTRQYLLWHIGFLHLQIMVADAPQLKKVKPPPPPQLESADDFKAFLKLKK